MCLWCFIPRLLPPLPDIAFPFTCVVRKGSGLADPAASPSFCYFILNYFETLSNWISITSSIKVWIKDLTHWLNVSLENEIEKSCAIIMCYMLIQASFVLLRRQTIWLFHFPNSLDQTGFQLHRSLNWVRPRSLMTFMLQRSIGHFQSSSF